MQIELKGRNVPVTDEMREHVDKRFQKIGRQVSELARMEVEVAHEKNPRNPDHEVAEVTLYLKGVTLRAAEAAPNLRTAINRCEEELAVQVKRHRDKRRRRREARAHADGGGISAAM